MWKFVDKICPKCGIDLTTIEPKRVRWREYGECPNCSYLCPVIDVEPEVKPPTPRSGRQRVSEPEAPAEAPPAEPVEEVPPPEPEE